VNKKFSIIIPHTKSNLLNQIIDALMDQTVDMVEGEILIVGEKSLRSIACNSVLRFVKVGEENRFASDKRNIGMGFAQGEIFLFLDDDCIPRKNWAARHLYQHSQGKVVVGGAVEFSRQNYWQLADNISAFHGIMSYTERGYRPYLYTTNLSVRRCVVESAGLMEPHRNRAEDLEWTARFRALGYPLYFEPGAVVVHNPDRLNLASVNEHWMVDAPATLRIRLKYAKLLNTPHLAKYRDLFLWGSPFIAAWATMRVFSHPHSLWKYWCTLPAVYWTKLVWCWSAYRNFPHGRIYR
jgi:GT2 family glycosyltransferase